MERQINLEEMIDLAEKAKKEYDEVLASGMMFEWFPQLTGNYDTDLLAWNSVYELLLKIRKEYGK
jgi:ribosome-binding factor A